jgi:hypothetical protein
VALVAVLIIVLLSVLASVSPEILKSLPGGSRGAQGPQRSATRGGACRPLEEARLALEEGRDRVVAVSLREAERKAIEALDTSWVSFGKPEELALRLNVERIDGRIAKRTQEDLLAKLEQVRGACEKLAS